MVEVVVPAVPSLSSPRAGIYVRLQCEQSRATMLLCVLGGDGELLHAGSGCRFALVGVHVVNDVLGMMQEPPVQALLDSCFGDVVFLQTTARAQEDLLPNRAFD